MAKLNGLVRNWSYSALSQYEKCAKQYFYQRIEKRPQPPSPNLDRGNRAHALLEQKLDPSRPTIIPPHPRGAKPLDLDHVDLYVDSLRGKKLRIEEMWYVNSDWEVVQTGGRYHPMTWLIVKMDVYVQAEKKAPPRVVDWKTGQRYEDHEFQGQLYSLAAYAYENGEFDTITTDMVYLDQPDDPIDEWSVNVAKMGDVLRENWNERAMRLFTETEWKATPSFKACNWCPFSGRKGGPCRAG